MTGLGAASAAMQQGALRACIWLLLALLSFTLHAQLSSAPEHFPLLRNVQRSVKTGSALDPKLRASLLGELEVERALWSDEVAHQKSIIEKSSQQGRGEALSRLAAADALAQSRLAALASVLKSGAALDASVIADVIGPASAPERIYSGSSRGSVPLKNLGRSKAAPLAAGPAYPEHYSDPPGPELMGAAKPRAARAESSPNEAASGETSLDIITAKAQELNNDPIALYGFVLNSVRPEHYFGSMKSPETVLRSLAGNDADQAALLAALYRAAGFPARLAYGQVEYDRAPIENHFGLSGDAALQEFLSGAGIPFTPNASGGQIVSYTLERVWCEVWIPYANFRGVALDKSGTTWLPLDPEFKSMTAPAARRILSEMGLGAAAFQADYLSGAFCADDPVPAGACPMARDALAGKVNQYLTAHGESVTYDGLSAPRALIAQSESLLPATLPGRITRVINVYLTLPDALQHRVRLVATASSQALMDVTLKVSDLSGREGMLWYAPATDADQAVVDSYGGDLWSVPPYMVNVTPQILAQGEEVARGSAGVGMGQPYDLTVTLLTPSGDSVSFTNNEIAGAPAGLGMGAGTQAYQTSGTDPVNTLETLSKLVNDHLDPKAAFESEMGVLLGLPVCHPFPSVTSVGSDMEPEVDAGLIQSLNFKGVYVDSDLWGARAVGGDAPGALSWMTLTSLNASSLERKVFESYGVTSVSADKAMALAHKQSIATVHIDQTNVGSVLGTLPYGQDVKDDISSWISAGGVADVPQAALTCLRWTGVGYLLSDPQTGEAKYQLAGSLSGGVTVMDVEEILAKINAFLAQFSNANVNPDPNQATKLEVASWDVVPVVTVDTEVPYPIVVIALDDQNRRVSGRSITFSANGDATFWKADPVHPQDPGTWVPSVTLTTDSQGEVQAKMKAGTQTWSDSVQPRYVKLEDTDKYQDDPGPLYGERGFFRPPTGRGALRPRKTGCALRHDVVGLERHL